jgi:hypothetical protein
LTINEGRNVTQIMSVIISLFELARLKGESSMPNKPHSVAILIIVALAVTGCGNPDPVIHGAYAISTAQTNPLGNDVRPDEFVIHALVSSRSTMRQGDTFMASLNVGTLGDISKYGGIAGLKFKVTPYPAGVAPYIVSLPARRFHYRAVSVSQPIPKISCDAQNRLKFSVAGEPQDMLAFRVKTAAMRNQLIARIGNHRIRLPPPWPPTVPNQADGNYILAPVHKNFHCLLEDTSRSGDSG